MALTADVDDLVGTANDDTFTAGLTVAGTQTLQSFDTIEGGEGTDTLNATLNSGTAVQPTLDSVEVLNIRSIDVASTLNLSDADGVEQVWTDRSSSDLNILGLGNLAAIGAKNVTRDNVDYNVTYAAGALAATETEQTLVLDSAKLANVAIDGASGIETLNVVLQGGESAIGVNNAGDATGLTVTDATLETVNLSGEGSLNLNQTLGAKTIDGSDVSGNLELTVGALGGGLTGARTVTAGSGDDVINVSALGALTAAITIDGGEGRDEIVVDAAVTTEQLVEKVSGFEVLNIDSFDAGTKSYAAFENIGYEALILTDADGGTLTGLNAESDLTLANSADVTLNVAGVTAQNKGSLDLTVEGGAASGAFDITSANVDTINIETVNTSSAATHTVATISVTGNDLEDLTITGDEAVSFSQDIANTALKTVDVSGVTASSNVVGNKTDYAAEIEVSTGVTVTGTAGADKISFGLNSTITGGDGADLFVLSTTADTVADGPVKTNNFATITDMTAEDTLLFGGFAVESAASAGSAGLEISEITVSLDPGVTATFADYINAADAGEVGFFVFEGNTYLVAGTDETNGPAASATNGDVTNALVVELTGVVDLEGFAYTADMT